MHAKSVEVVIKEGQHGKAERHPGLAGWRGHAGNQTPPDCSDTMKRPMQVTKAWNARTVTDNLFRLLPANS